MMDRFLTNSRRVLGKGLKRTAQLFAGFFVGYVAFLLVGLVPVNNDFEPTDHGVVVYFASTSIHADIIVPIRSDEWDWSEWFPAEDFTHGHDWASHMAIGWGDRGFYLDTPEWSDLKASTAASAMFMPSSSVMHVVCFELPAEVPKEITAHRLTISNEQYRALCESIVESLEVDAKSSVRQIPGEAFATNDAFYEAHGSYHCFYTCNSWVGRRMVDAGIRAPLWTPLPKTPMLYLD